MPTNEIKAAAFNDLFLQSFKAVLKTD